MVAAVQPVLAGAWGHTRQAGGFGGGTFAPQQVHTAELGGKEGTAHHCLVTQHPETVAEDGNSWRKGTSLCSWWLPTHTLMTTRQVDVICCTLLQDRCARASEVTSSWEILPSADKTLLPMVAGLLCFLAPPGQTFAGSHGCDH